MAAKTDQFNKFREATLGNESLSGVLTGKAQSSPVSQQQSKSSAKPSRNANRRLVSFRIDNDMFQKLGLLKFETGVKYDELYNEAVYDLLRKHGRI